MITNNKCAAITISHNESFFLPLWLKYHYKFFDPKDIYVIDHISTDGSTDNLECNVIKWDYQLTFSVHEIVNKVKSVCYQLREKYEYILFSETDELLIPDPVDYGRLDEFIMSATLPTYRAGGLEIIHLPEMGELPLNINKPIFEQRKYCFHGNGYDKTLLARDIPDWSMGFHEAENQKHIPPLKNLYLIHLKRLDYNMLLAKNNMNAKSNIDPNSKASSLGAQCWITDEERFKSFFYVNFPIFEIPEQLRDII